MEGSKLLQVGSALCGERFATCADNCELERFLEFRKKIIILEAVATDRRVRNA
jgi:hypothetical protein